MTVLNARRFVRIRRHYAFWVLVCLCALSFNSLASPAFGGEIHKAAINGEVARVKALLAADPGLVFSKDENGWTPLETLAATVTSSSDMVLDFGSSYGSTANATKTREVKKPFDSPEAMEIAELLIANGAELNGATDRASALLQAVRNKNWRLAELFIKKGAKVDVVMPEGPNDPGMTPLHYAAGYGGTDIAKLLIANKAKVDAKDGHNRTPLHFAAMFGQKDVMELLIANKADVNAKDVKGWTPLQWAENYDQGVVAAILRQHGGH